MWPLVSCYIWILEIESYGSRMRPCLISLDVRAKNVRVNICRKSLAPSLTPLPFLHILHLFPPPHPASNSEWSEFAMMYLNIASLLPTHVLMQYRPRSTLMAGSKWVIVGWPNYNMKEGT